MPNDAAPVRLGDLIDNMYDLREEKRALEEQLRIINERLENFEFQIRAKLDELGTTQAKGTRGAASISEQEVFQIGDTDSFFAYLAEHQAWHLVQRRPASNAIRELIAMGTEVPGITSFTKRNISLRKA